MKSLNAGSRVQAKSMVIPGNAWAGGWRGGNSWVQAGGMEIPECRLEPCLDAEIPGSRLEAWKSLSAGWRHGNS